MKTYAEKLKDPRWQDFRQIVFNHYGFECRVCGSSKPSGPFNHVHHKRYISGRDPWEYDLCDVSVLCEDCHKEIHDCENKWRDMIRSMPPWLIVEWNSMADAFTAMDPRNMTTWASYCKNQARAFQSSSQSYETTNEEIY
jgi:hypothetical protein